MRLELAGTPLCVPPDASPVPLAPRDAALLAWLAIEGPTPRGRLATLLWPDSEPAAARGALRQRLFQLRRALGRDLAEGSSVLALADGIVHDLASAETVLGAESFDDSAEFSEWLATQRRARLERRIEALASAAEQAEANGELAAALEHAQALARLNPTSEHAHRRVMRLHYLRGDAAAALAAFETCARVLRESLGAAPSRETVALRASVSQAHLPVREGPQPLPAGMLRPPRLVGRAQELRAARAGWEAGQVVLLTGEAGLGKSRLLYELAATDPGCVLASARPGDAVVPYAALARLLRALAERMNGAAQALPGSPLTTLVPATIAPANLATGRGAAEAAAAPDNAGALTVQQGAQALLRSAGAAGVSAVILDDLHFADAASIELLIALFTRRDALPGLRFAFAQRPAEGPAALAQMAEHLLEDHALTLVPVTPLDAPAMREFVESLALGLDGEATTRLAAQLHQHTGGNPLFALETLRQAWIEQRLGDAALPRPINVARVIERRLARLAPPALRLARCAAVAGVDFSIDLAARVFGVPALDLADAWSELEAAQVLRDGAFAHDLIFEATRASVPEPIARHLHGQIADYLATRNAEPARLAAHWDSAQRWSDAARAYTQAAERTRADGRRAEEAALLANAARCHDAAGETDAHFEALHARADVLVRFGAGEESARAVAAAENAARTDVQALRATLARVMYEDQRGAVEAVLRLAPPAIERARALGDTGLVLRLAAPLAQSLSDARRGDEAVRLLESLRQWIETDAPEQQRFDYWMAHALALDYANRLTEALNAWQAARAVAERNARGDLAWQATSGMASTHAKLGRVGLSAELGLQALLEARADADLPPARVMRAQVTAAHRLRDLGRYAEALPMLEEALAFFRQAEGRSPMVGAVEHRLAQAYLQLGQPARAQALLANDPGAMPPGLTMLRHLHRADLAFHLGQAAAALRELRTALALMPDPDDVYHRVACMFGATIVPPDEGEAMATGLAAWASAHQRFGLALAGHTLAAACALAQNAPLRARPQAEAALRLGTDYQTDSFYLPKLWLVAGQTFAANGDTQAAADAVSTGVRWVRRAAGTVPDAFRDSFLNRNPVNRELLTLATRLRLPS